MNYICEVNNVTREEKKKPHTKKLQTNLKTLLHMALAKKILGFPLSSSTYKAADLHTAPKIESPFDEVS